ncbi:Uncharacterized protein TCM_046165 [Theobroma cacao]|uniref:Uncharacterized protein n=1 Tax=Theobroma cacao TaxID=3641 RepID=S1RWN3_THECC|nr:Uncharacterized protein TCM_046165 [Theobroma cacao]
MADDGELGTKSPQKPASFNSKITPRDKHHSKTCPNPPYSETNPPTIVTMVMRTENRPLDQIYIYCTSGEKIANQKRKFQK